MKSLHPQVFRLSGTANRVISTALDGPLDVAWACPGASDDNAIFHSAIGDLLKDAVELDSLRWVEHVAK